MIYPQTPSYFPEQQTEWNVRDSAAFVPDLKYCSLEVPISQLNAQINTESLTASFITWIGEPSWALKDIYRNWRRNS